MACFVTSSLNLEWIQGAFDGKPSLLAMDGLLVGLAISKASGSVEETGMFSLARPC